jgi:uncharacterized protein with von Willebrand factor type A (vWA) domain
LTPEEAARETIRQLVGQLGSRRGRLIENVLLFGAILRRRKLDVTTRRTLDALESLSYIDIFNREDFYTALRANLVSDEADLERFDRTFNEFWTPVRFDEIERDEVEQQSDETLESAQDDEEGEPQIEDFLTDEENEDDEDDSQERETPGYSLEEVLRKKDFSTYTDDDVRNVRKLIQKLAPKIATKLSRRTKPDASGDIVDLRRTMRMNLRYGGDIVELARKSKKRKKLKLVLLCDVSGSMDVYSRFLIQFIYGLQQELPNVETFVFSTRLTRVTEFFKRKELTRALQNISDIVQDWSGGTSIGAAIREFNEGPGKSMVDGRTVVMIISDGWDRGDTTVLDHEMAVLSRRAYKTIWLNPLLGSPNYQPLCKGMQAALPYTDYFLPAHNLESLMNLARTLETISAA